MAEVPTAATPSFRGTTRSEWYVTGVSLFCGGEPGAAASTPQNVVDGVEAVVFASYGTTLVGELAASIEPVARALGRAFPQASASRTYTSEKVLRALAGTSREVPSLPAELERLAGVGVRSVVVQPGHLLRGESFDALRRQIASVASAPVSLALGEPLLCSEQDVAQVAEVLCAECARRDGWATVLVGHGFGRDERAGRAVGLVNPYVRLGEAFVACGRDDLLVGAMEVDPESEAGCLCGIDAVLAHLGGLPELRGVTLRPLMLTAGRHARLQIAGSSPLSWESRLAAAGLEVEAGLVGLGALAGIQSLYVAHAKAAARAMA